MSNIFDLLGRALGSGLEAVGQGITAQQLGPDWEKKARMLGDLNRIDLQGRAQRIETERENAGMMRMYRESQAEAAKSLAKSRELAALEPYVGAIASRPAGADISDIVSGLDAEKASIAKIMGEAARAKHAQTLADKQTRFTEDTTLGGRTFKAGQGYDKAEVDALLELEKERGRNLRDVTGPSGSGRGGLTPTAEANIINRLSTQWTTAIKPVAEMTRQAKLMRVGLEAARRGDMAQGSQAVLVTFQKILDPTSVVRESEYARSGQGLALLDQVQGAYEKLKVGGAGVPLDELERYAKLADEAARAFNTGYVDSVKRRIGLTADRFQIPHDVVFDDFDFNSALGGVSNQTQSGDIELVRGPDGKLRRK